MPLPSDLPEGVDEQIIVGHALTLRLTGELLNLAGAFMNAKSGSPGEDQAESALAEAMEGAVLLPRTAIMSLLMSFTTIILTTCNTEDVQRWFDFQAKQINEALE